MESVGLLAGMAVAPVMQQCQRVRELVEHMPVEWLWHRRRAVDVNDLRQVAAVVELFKHLHGSFDQSVPI